MDGYGFFLNNRFIVRWVKCWKILSLIHISLDISSISTLLILGTGTHHSCHFSERLAGFTVLVHCCLCLGNNRFSSPVCQMRNPAASPALPSSNQSSWHACSVHLSFNSSLLHKFDTQQNMLSRCSTLRGHPAKSHFPSHKQIHRELTECTS